MMCDVIESSSLEIDFLNPWHNMCLLSQIAKKRHLTPPPSAEDRVVCMSTGVKRGV